jgi:hypothetical protein
MKGLKKSEVEKILVRRIAAQSAPYCPELPSAKGSFSIDLPSTRKILDTPLVFASQQ